MIDIFLSYAAEDRGRAKAIAGLFSRQGWSVWWDRTIPPGKAFDEVIESALESSKCVIVLWSRSSITSAWVKTEASEGASRGVLIPILLDEVKIPLEFRRIQAANLVSWDNSPAHPELERVFDSVAVITGTPRQSVDVKPEDLIRPPEPTATENASPKIGAGRALPGKTLIFRGVSWVLILAVPSAVIFCALDGMTVIGSGPALSGIGLLVAWCANRHQNRLWVGIGLSAPCVVILCVILIKLSGWGPSDVRLPLSMIGSIYTVVIGFLALFETRITSRLGGRNPGMR